MLEEKLKIKKNQKNQIKKSNKKKSNWKIKKNQKKTKKQ